MLKNTYKPQDTDNRNEGPEEKNWRSTLNRPRSLQPKNLQTENICPKRKNFSSVSQAKHLKINDRPVPSEEVTSSPDLDDDLSEFEIPYHSQENSIDNSLFLSTLDIDTSGLSSPGCSITDDSRTTSPNIEDVFHQGKTTKGFDGSGDPLQLKKASDASWLKGRSLPADWYKDLKSYNELPLPVDSALQAILHSIPDVQQHHAPATNPHQIATYLNNDYPTVQPVYLNTRDCKENESHSISSPNVFDASRQESAKSFEKELKKQLEKRTLEVFRRVHGQGSIYTSVNVEKSKPKEEKYAVSPFHPPNKMLRREETPKALNEDRSSEISIQTEKPSIFPTTFAQVAYNGATQTEKPSIFPTTFAQVAYNGATEKPSIFPSTFAQVSYYRNKLPEECLERNKFYINSNLLKCMSNSYDNLSETESVKSPSASPQRPPQKSSRPQQRYSFPLTKKTVSPEHRLHGFQNELRKSVPKYNLEDVFPLNLTEKVIDTHCHLDFLFQKENHKGTFGAYKNKNSKDFLPSFGGCVANFIDPYFYNKSSNWEDLVKEEGVWASFGVHPHFCYRYDEVVEEKVLEAIKHEKVVAIGEIGLDYSFKNNCNKAMQLQVFERQLAIAVKHKMPLIIHCRDAQEDCLKILSKNVPVDTKIHRHCFTGNWTEAKEWLDAFPNLYLGFTSLVTFRSVGYLHEVVRLTPTDRLLFETDAPYFLPSQVADNLNCSESKEKRHSNPGMVAHVAAQIAAIKGITDFSAFLRTVRNNTKAMYNI